MGFDDRAGLPTDRDGELGPQLTAQARDDLILRREQITNRFVETLSPEMRSALGGDQLRVDANAVPSALDGAFEHIANAELLADRLGVDVLPLESEGGASRDYGCAGEARQVRSQAFGHSVGEIVL